MGTAYIDEQGKPRLAPSVVAYIDILGYREHIRNNSGRDELLNLRNALTEAYNDLKPGISGGMNLKRETHVRTFTDNLIIAIPQPTYESGDSVYWAESMVSKVCFIQAQLATDGYLIRGAIAFGEFFIDKDIVFGKALIDAYDAERDLAVFPRVILHESTIQAFKAHGSQSVYGLLKDYDNQIFVDYLSESVNTIPADCEISPYFVEGHKVTVIKNLKKFANKPHILAKYEWAANYHNHFCDKYKKTIPSHYKIPPECLIRPINKWFKP